MLTQICQTLLLGQTPDVWANSFLGLDQEQRFVILLVGIGCLTGILLGLPITLIGMLGSTNRHRLEAEMKRDMLDRGMSAGEIGQVIQAATPPEYLRKLSRLQNV